MRAPDFWYEPAGASNWKARALAPIAKIYAGATAFRLARGARHRVAAPVICIGNINVGGTGKTPVAIAVAELLTSQGRTPHVVSKGYGGSLEGPTLVDETRHDAAQTGDEPLLLSSFVPTWVARDRRAGAQAALAQGASHIILDDGFQNASLAHDLSIVVVDAAFGFGNGRVIPAGPLREPVETGLARADCVIAIGAPELRSGLIDRWHGLRACPVVLGELTPLQTGMDWRDLRVFAFAGIGHPQKFFATLKSLGASVIRAEPLDDHQPLTTQLMARLEKEAAAAGAQLVTTEKDAVRLPQAFRRKVLTLPVRLQFEDAGFLNEALSRLSETHAP